MRFMMKMGTAAREIKIRYPATSAGRKGRSASARERIKRIIDNR